MTSPVVGIDLGTTNTVVGVVRGGQAITLADSEGHRLLPSVVSFHPNGTVLVGREAKARRHIDAGNTIYSIKRLIGRAWSSKEVTLARKRFSFEMREGPGNAALVATRDETYTLPEISAFVLRKAKQLAEQALGTEVKQAVITVPANFNDLQRAATKVAGRVAGLEVLRILNEPTAAALAYGFGRGCTERLAVYDFGGGTLDATLLDLSGNVFEVLATAGDTFLGGDDIDVLVAEHVADQCLRQYRFDARSHRESFEQLRASAELLKIRLSTERVARIDIPDFVPVHGGRLLTLSCSMTRTEFEQLTAPIVDRTFEVCRDALSVAGLKPGEFNHVMLVGGSTRIPLVRQRVQDFFLREPVGHLNPDEVVAIGAAIQANALAAGQRRRSVVPAPPTHLCADSTPPPFLSGVGTAPGPQLPDADLGAPPPRPRQNTLRIENAAPSQEPPPRARQDTVRLPGARPPHESSPPTRSPALPLVTAAGLVRMAPEDLPLVLPREVQELDDDELSDLEPTPPWGHPSPTRSAEVDPDEEETPPTDPIPGVAPPPRAGMGSKPPPPYATGRSIDPESTDATAGGTLIQARDSRTHVAPVVQSVRAPGPVGDGVPLLLDVTPLSLSVETVRGFCDAIIVRNTPVPCERTRVFATASDNQRGVRVRVSQGESSRFEDNTLLGELELSGLRPVPRGKLQIEVTFVLDTDGILNVHARDVQTGRATSARVKLEGLSEVDDAHDVATRDVGRPTI